MRPAHVAVGVAGAGVDAWAAGIDEDAAVGWAATCGSRSTSLVDVASPEPPPSRRREGEKGACGRGEGT